MNGADPLIDPEFSVALIAWGGWILAALGVLKLLVFAIGEWAPGFYDRFRSDGFRNFMVGRGNRLVFGLGGLVTALIGLAFVGVAVVLGLLVDRL